MPLRCAVLLTLVVGCRLSFDLASDAARGGDGDAANPDVAPPGPLPNRVFVTSATFTGRLVSGSLTGVTAGDAICTAAASDAGMTGTFAAWLSSETRNATDLLTGSSGWVRVDGAPFAETVADLAAENVFAAFSIDEHGQLVPDNARIWLGGSRGGMTAGTDTCGGFTVDTTGMATMRDARGIGETGTAYAQCTQQSRIGCLEYGRQAAVPFLGTGRYAFGVELWNGTSLASADAACTAKATQLGLPGTYVAALATSTQSIAERAGSLTGPWQLPRHIPITAGPLGGTLVAPLGQGNGRQYLAWLGAGTLIDRQPNGALSCNDWTASSGGGGAVGNLAYDDAAAYLVGFAVTCGSMPVGLLCLQHD